MKAIRTEAELYCELIRFWDSNYVDIEQSNYHIVIEPNNNNFDNPERSNEDILRSVEALKEFLVDLALGSLSKYGRYIFYHVERGIWRGGEQYHHQIWEKK